jgi:hypothetical protein
MKEETRNKIYSLIVNIDGIEKAEEIINAVEYLEENPPSEKVNVLLNWQTDQLDLNNKQIKNLFSLINQAETLIASLIFVLALSGIANLIFLILFIKK